MLQKACATLMSLALVVTTLGPLQSETLPAGTSVVVKLSEKVSSATHKKGDTINFTVVSDVTLNGRKIIATGAPVTGTVINASKRFILGIGGQLDIRVDKVQAVDGTWVPLQYTQGEHSGSSLVSIICGVVCCCIFFFIPGKDVSIEKDKIFETKVVSPTTTK